MKLVRWSHGSANWTGDAIDEACEPAALDALPLDAGGRYYRGEIEFECAGTLVLNVWSPRPLRMWLDGVSVMDEPLTWRSYQRHVRAAVVIPVKAGKAELRVELGERPAHLSGIDDDCPSRNRERVMSELKKNLPDVLKLSGRVVEGVEAAATSLAFSPSQFHRDGLVWQKLIARPIHTDAPSVQLRDLGERGAAKLVIDGSVCPGRMLDATTDQDARAGLKRFYVPVGAPHAPIPVSRGPSPEKRVEPVAEQVATAQLTVEGGGGSAVLDMPIYEMRGRLAPQREYRALAWPSAEEIVSLVPEPVLPPEKAHLKELYDAAWRMLMNLVRTPPAESGLPNSYMRTALGGFHYHQFVWDTSFTAMAAAYGWRHVPVYASFDCLYSHQFDGGYIHREIDVRDALPALFEPDFSPNPPVMAVAEWRMATLSGNVERIHKVYRALAEHHEWLESNRRLADGTFWTTGLANGLDNSPSLGEGYPDLTAQMAHQAEILAMMASLIGETYEVERWTKRHDEIGAALNEKLWSDSLQFYSTSLADGGHNMNKVVTGFWPMWANVVPPERVEALAKEVKNPKSFWRHHPVPSLAADSPQYSPGGDYWLGSTWAPTNCATIKGFQRAGRLDVAREILDRHLQCMHEVYKETGHIWENYCAEKSERGNISGPEYSWSAVGPIALMLEVMIGLEPDALQRKLTWTPLAGKHIGVKRYPLGPCTIDLVQQQRDGKDVIEVNSDLPFLLDIVRDGKTESVMCAGGRTLV